MGKNGKNIKTKNNNTKTKERKIEKNSRFELTNDLKSNTLILQAVIWGNISEWLKMVYM